jgi:hypothetical protein
MEGVGEEREMNSSPCGRVLRTVGSQGVPFSERREVAEEIKTLQGFLSF